MLSAFLIKFHFIADTKAISNYVKKTPKQACLTNPCVIHNYGHFSQDILKIDCLKLTFLKSYIQSSLRHSQEDVQCGWWVFWITYKPLMSESEQSTLKQKQLQKQPNRSLLSPVSSPSPTDKQKHSPLPFKLHNEQQSGLYQENRQLRRKLKDLSSRLDEELSRAAQLKLKQLSQRIGHPVTAQSQSLQLQNAYKMIERLQKTVKEYESKEMYHVTLKRVMDLEGTIRKKDQEIEELRTEIKTQKRIVKEKEKHIEELIENSKKLGNPTEDLETIAKLKAKMKKLAEEAEGLRRKQLEKHDKLVKTERKIAQLQQAQKQQPLSCQVQSLQRQLQQSKGKHKQLMQRIERQNIYISKLNEKLSQQPKKAPQKKHHYSASLDDLPKLKPNLRKSELDISPPSPNARIKRY